MWLESKISLVLVTLHPVRQRHHLHHIQLLHLQIGLSLTRPAPHNTARSPTRRPRSASGDPRRPRGHLLHPQGASGHPDLRLSLIRPPEPWRWRGGRPCLAWRSPALGSPARRPTPCRRLRRYSSAAAPVLFGFMPNFVLVLLCAVIRTEIERLTVGFSYRI
jgi:hypothetical protein